MIHDPTVLFSTSTCPASAARCAADNIRPSCEVRSLETAWRVDFFMGPDLLTWPEINPYKLGSWGPWKTSDLVLGGKKNKLEVARLRVFLWKTSGLLWCHRVGAAKPPKWLSSNCSSSSISNDFIGSQPICHPGFLPKNSTKVLKKLQDFTMTTKSCLVCLSG